MFYKQILKVASAMMLGASLVIGFPSCENPEVMNTLKELQESDSISKADLAKLQSLLSQAQKKVAETEQELQNVKQNQGGSSKVDLSEIEGEISGINSKIEGWKKKLEEKVDSLPTAEQIEEIGENLYQLQWQIWQINANGYEFVDLGLSVLWATCNIGAENPWDYGQYFAWGDTTGYAKDEAHEFNWANCFDTTDGETFITYHNEDGGLKELTADHDAATHHWGGKWRMPSKDELKELYDKSRIHSEWVTNYKDSNVKGRVFYKKKEGDATYDVNSDVHIYLPAAGYRDSVALSDGGSLGLYGCSLLASPSSYAWYLEFSSDDVSTNNDFRYYGLSVRPVFRPEN